jgi:hypothetical protein
MSKLKTLKHVSKIIKRKNKTGKHWQEPRSYAVSKYVQSREKRALPLRIRKEIQEMLLD